MKAILMEGGKVFFRHFTPIYFCDLYTLLDFIPIYKAFEKQNLIFKVLEESQEKFEVIVKKYLVYEAFEELEIHTITQWMCNIAFNYFNDYQPNIQYIKDRMIARGDDSCHEIFLWIDKENFQEI
jgi:hypothetical protein